MRAPPTVVSVVVMVVVMVVVATPSTTATEGGGSLLGDTLLKTFGRPFAPTSPESLTRLCREHSLQYLEALDSFTPWALHMYDSSTKIPSGAITGNIMQLGNYEQCVSVLATPGASGSSPVVGQRSSPEHAFNGQLCTADIQFSLDDSEPKKKHPTAFKDSSPLDMKDLLTAVAQAAGLQNWTGPTSALYKWAFCVPSTCQASDVEKALLETLQPLNSPGRVKVIVKVADNQCLTRGDDQKLTSPDLAIICVFAIFGLLLILSTTFDLAVYRRASSKYEKNKTRDAILLAFSVYTNGSNLLETKGSKDTLTCMNGIRFLTLCWVVFGHTYYMSSVSPQINSLDVQKLRYDWTKMVVMNGTLCTDTFFFLSGVLLCYVFLRQMAREQHFNLAKFYLHRYIRLTPPLAIAIFFYATLFYHLDSGPMWNTWVRANRDYCVESWWRNLLYFNNYVENGRMCMDHTWYLAVDMQLFCMSPLIIYPLWRWPRLGKVTWGVFLCAAIITPFVITYTMGLAGAMLYATDMKMVGKVYVNIYSKMYTRGGPYLIGIAVGYFLHVTRNQQLKLSKVGVAVGWLCSILLCLVSLLGVYPMYQQGYQYSPLAASSYAALGRTVWALGIAWVVFACVRGYGGIVNTMLSWKVFLPLSRISYSAYICHFIVLLYNAGTVRSPGFYSSYEVVRQFLGNIFITLSLATVIYLTFEVPFMALDRVLLSKGEGKRNPKQNVVVIEDANRVVVDMSADVGENSRHSVVALGKETRDQTSGSKHGCVDLGPSTRWPLEGASDKERGSVACSCGAPNPLNPRTSACGDNLKDRITAASGYVNEGFEMAGRLEL